MNHPATWAEAAEDAERLALMVSEIDGWVGEVRPHLIAELPEAELERIESLAHKLQILTTQARHFRGERARP